MDDKIRTIRVHNFGGSGECSTWALMSDMVRYNGASDKIEQNLIAIESADPNKILPDSLGNMDDIFEFTGRFYKDRFGYSETCKDRKYIEKGRIFRYISYKVIQRDYNSNN